MPGEWYFVMLASGQPTQLLQLDTEKPMDPVETILELVNACNERDLPRILQLFREDTIYHNMPTEPLHGIEGVRSVMQPFLEMSAAIEWIVHHIALSPRGTVLVERTDRFLVNGHWLSLPVMGAFEVLGGQITHWRDYYDQEVILRQLKAASAGIGQQTAPG